MQNSCYKGEKKVTRDEDWEARAHGQELHHSSSAGPWSSTNPHCNGRQQRHQHPFTSSSHFLAETQLSYFPSPLHAWAISPRSIPCPTSSISSAPQLPHQVSSLPSKVLRTYSGTCKQLTSLRHPPVPHYKSNLTKNLNNGNITKTKSVSPNLPKSLCKM